MTPFDSLSWGNDDGTRCEAVHGSLTIYLISCEKGDYWRIVMGAKETLVKEGYGEDSLKTVFNILGSRKENNVYPAEENSFSSFVDTAAADGKQASAVKKNSDRAKSNKGWKLSKDI